jgi:hypothetical protein
VVFMRGLLPLFRANDFRRPIMHEVCRTRLWWARAVGGLVPGRRGLGGVEGRAGDVRDGSTRLTRTLTMWRVAKSE